MSKCDFNKVALLYLLRHGCSPVNLLQIFRTPFPMNTSGWRLLGILFINILSVLLNDYFFTWIAYKPLLSRFSFLSFATTTFIYLSYILTNI